MKVGTDRFLTTQAGPHVTPPCPGHLPSPQPAHVKLLSHAKAFVQLPKSSRLVNTCTRANPCLCFKVAPPAWAYRLSRSPAHTCLLARLHMQGAGFTARLRTQGFVPHTPSPL